MVLEEGKKEKSKILPLNWLWQCNAMGNLEEELQNKLILKNTSAEIQIVRSNLITATLQNYSIQMPFYSHGLAV